MEFSLLTLRNVGRKLGIQNVSGFRKEDLLQQVVERLEAKGKTLEEYAKEVSVNTQKGYVKKKFNLSPKGETRTRKEAYLIRYGKNLQRMTVGHSAGLQKSWERITTLFPFAVETILTNHKLAVFY